MEQVSEYDDWSVLNYWNSTQTTATLNIRGEIQWHLTNPEGELKKAKKSRVSECGWLDKRDFSLMYDSGIHLII